MPILTLILLALFTILFIGLVLYFAINFVETVTYWNSPGKILFLPTNTSNIERELSKIVEQHCTQTADFHLLELGCGRAGVLRFLSNKYNWKSVVGIEGQFTVWLQAKLACLGQNIDIIRTDIFAYQSPKPAIIYCYLGTQIMQDLYKKGKLNNALVITMDYAIEGQTPIQKIQLESRTKIQKQILVYDFRQSDIEDDGSLQDLER